MLVLTRKVGQKLIINDNIEVVILESRGDAVKIGVNAPKNVTIFREEIYEEIKKANVESSKDVKLSDIDKAVSLLGSKTPEKSGFNLQQLVNKKIDGNNK